MELKELEAMPVRATARGVDLGHLGDKGRRLFQKVRCGDCGGTRWLQFKPVLPTICGACNKLRNKSFFILPREQH